VVARGSDRAHVHPVFRSRHVPRTRALVTARDKYRKDKVFFEGIGELAYLSI
jgi:hypothetical protein